MADEDKKTEEDNTEEKEAEAPAEEKPEAQEEAAPEEKEEVEVPDKFKALVEQIESMPVLELHELVKVLEKKFDVSAAAVAVAAPGGATGGGDGGEEQDEFTVELTDAGAQKIQVIKAVKEILGLGLKEAKDMVDGAPAVLKEGVKKEDAEEMKKKVEEAGGKVELK